MRNHPGRAEARDTRLMLVFVLVLGSYTVIALTRGGLTVICFAAGLPAAALAITTVAPSRAPGATRHRPARGHGPRDGGARPPRS